MTRCLLAIDSGGTKCDALVVRDDGTVLGWGRSDPPGQGQGRFATGSGRSSRAVLSAVTKALGTTSYDELHIANRTDAFPLSLLPTHSTRIAVHPVSEYGAAWALVGETCGVVVLAGTGAFVHGKTRDGRHLHLDGLGPLLGDHGGGYHIGLLAIRAAAQSGWHPRRHTSLADAIFRACGGRTGDELGTSLVHYMLAERDRSEIASLARIVNEEANAGDLIAGDILRTAAAEIAATTYDVVDNLGMANDEYALVGTGSIAVKSPIYWDHLCMLVREFAPNLRPVKSDLPAIVGVAVSALQRMPDLDLAAVKARLFETARTVFQSPPPPPGSGPKAESI